MTFAKEKLKQKFDRTIQFSLAGSIIITTVLSLFLSSLLELRWIWIRNIGFGEPVFPYGPDRILTIIHGFPVAFFSSGTDGRFEFDILGLVLNILLWFVILYAMSKIFGTFEKKKTKRNKIFTRVIVVVIILAFFTSSVNAAEYLISEQPTSWGVIMLRRHTQAEAQSFPIPADFISVTKVQIRVSRTAGATAGNLNVGIRDDLYGSNRGTVSKSMSSISTSPTWYTLTFSTPVPITGGQQHYVVYQLTDTQPVGEYINYRYDRHWGSDWWPDGDEWFMWSDGTWEKNCGEGDYLDHAFRVYGYKATSTPHVETRSATDIGTSTATLNGELINMGGYSSCEVWFKWGEVQGAYPFESSHETKTSVGTFDYDISNLHPDTRYHCRAYASNGDGQEEGSDLSFWTDPPIVVSPTVKTDPATNVGETMATLNGDLTSMGYASSCTVWFKYGKTTSYGTSTPGQTKTSTGSFNKGISGLEDGTEYHFKAYASNSAGTSSGIDRTFTTTGGNDPPIATIDFPVDGGTHSEEDNIFFEGSGTDPDGWITAYEWLKNGESLSTSRTFYKQLDPGTYEIKFRVKDNDVAWSGYDIHWIYVGAEPPVVVQFSASKYTAQPDEKITLSWTTIRTDYVDLYGNETFLGTYLANDDQDVWLNNTITFKIIAYGADGETDEDELTIKVLGGNGGFGGGSILEGTNFTNFALMIAGLAIGLFFLNRWMKKKWPFKKKDEAKKGYYTIKINRRINEKAKKEK